MDDHAGYPEYECPDGLRLAGSPGVSAYQVGYGVGLSGGHWLTYLLFCPYFIDCSPSLLPLLLLAGAAEKEGEYHPAKCNNHKDAKTVMKSEERGFAIDETTQENSRVDRDWEPTTKLGGEGL
jgi:hypothetical protein